MPVSAQLYELLKPADGATTLGALARPVGGLTDSLNTEVFGLWQQL